MSATTLVTGVLTMAALVGCSCRSDLARRSNPPRATEKLDKPSHVTLETLLADPPRPNRYALISENAQNPWTGWIESSTRTPAYMHVQLWEPAVFRQAPTGEVEVVHRGSENSGGMFGAISDSGAIFLERNSHRLLYIVGADAPLQVTFPLSIALPESRSYHRLEAYALWDDLLFCQTEVDHRTHIGCVHINTRAGETRLVYSIILEVVRREPRDDQPRWAGVVSHLRLGRYLVFWNRGNSNTLGRDVPSEWDQSEPHVIDLYTDRLVAISTLHPSIRSQIDRSRAQGTVRH